jgi:DNA-binding NarL/FixJ family response regulator
MSEKDPRPTVAELIPSGWRDFLRSGRYADGNTSIQDDGSEVTVDLAARLEIVDERRLAIHMTLVENGSELSPAAAQSAGRPLTDREREVVVLIALGQETGGIAQELSISVDTVRTHVRNAMAKLGAHTRAQLVALAMSQS